MKRFLAAAACAVALALPCELRASAPDSGGFPSREAQLHYLHGLLLEHAGALAEALKEYEAALSIDPDSAYLEREAAEVALELGNPDKAEGWARKVLAAAPKAVASRVLMGRVLWARGQLEPAQAEFEEALRLDPESAESTFALAGLLAARDPSKAERLLQAFSEKSPANASEAQFQIAKLAQQQGETERAKEHLKRAVDLDPEEALPARYALAQAYEVERSTEQALEQYLAIAKIEPENVSLLDHIGEIYIGENDLARAKALFEQAKRVQPADPPANHWLASLAEKDGDFQRAADYLRQSAALPEEASLNLRLSYYLTQAGKLPEAVQVLEDAHRRWPFNDQVSYFLALGYDDLKQEDKAIELLRQAVSLKPDYREARYQLAVLLEKTGRIDEAEKHFRQLLAEKPDDASTLNYLGYSLADRGLKLPEAEQMIRRAVELDPQNGAYRDSLGWVHLKQGRSTEAVHELLEALDYLPEDETVWEHAGDAFESLGDHAAAWRYWKRAQSLTQGPSSAARKVQKLQGRFSRDELGKLFDDYFSMALGGIRKVSGLCRLEGSILGKDFSYQGMITFAGPDQLDIDLLGPLFTPILRMRRDAQGFQMDPVSINGISQQDALGVASQSISLVRDYLSGRLFHLQPSRYRKSWRHQWVQSDGWRLNLDSDAVLIKSIVPDSSAVRSLSLDDFGRDQGRLLPKRLTVSGKGFRFAIDFTDVKVELAPLSRATTGR